MDKIKQLFKTIYEKIKSIDYLGLFLIFMIIAYIVSLSIADNKNQREKLECFDKCTPYASKILEKNSCWCFVDSNTLKKQTEQ